MKLPEHIKLPELWNENVFIKYVLESTTDKEFRERMGFPDRRAFSAFMKSIMPDPLPKGMTYLRFFRYLIERNPSKEELESLEYSSYLEDIKAHVYLLELEHNGHTFLKVGVSSNIPNRIQKIKSSLNFSSVYCLAKTELLSRESALNLESKILNKFNRYTHTSVFDGHTECLNFPQKEEILNEIK